MKEKIGKFKSEIQELESLIKLTEDKETYFYKNSMQEIRDILTPAYKLKAKKEDIENVLELYEKCVENNIDLTKKYFFMDNVYMEFETWCSLEPTMYFFLDNDSWFYENYISSHSGLNEWIFDLINEKYSLYSGNSAYSHAFGTCDLKGINNLLKNVREDEFRNKRRYNNEQVIQQIKGLIDFVEGKSKLKKVIVDELKYMFKNMEKLVKEEI